MSFIYSQSFTNPASFVEIGLSDVEIIRLKEVSKNHHHHFSLVRRMNEVNARRARLQPRWVTVFGRVYHLGT